MKSMTTKEKFIDMCFQRLLSLRTSTQIVEKSILIINRISKDYKITWDRPASEYPDAIYATLWILIIQKMALKWINKNVPEAFYKSLFQ